MQPVLDANDAAVPVEDEKEEGEERDRKVEGKNWSRGNVGGKRWMKERGGERRRKEGRAPLPHHQNLAAVQADKFFLV